MKFFSKVFPLLPTSSSLSNSSFPSFPSGPSSLTIEEYLENHQSSKTIFTFYTWHIMLLLLVMLLKAFGFLSSNQNISIFTLLRLVSLIPISLHLYHVYQRKYQPTWRSQPFRVSHLENAYLFSVTMASSVALIGGSLTKECNLPVCDHILPGQLQPALLYQNIFFSILSPVLVKAHHPWCAWLTFSLSFAASIISGIIANVSTSTFLMLCAMYLLGAVVLYDNELTLRQLYQHHITQEENLLLKLKASNEKELLAIKENHLRHLFGNVAHDFKSPLQSFTQELELLQKTLPTDNHSSRQSIAILQNVCNFMLMMINRAIDYSKVSSGISLVPSLNKTNLAETLTWVINSIGTTDVPVKLEPFPPTLCLTITTDQQWLRENLLCLVSNALKFTSFGDIVIRCSLESSEQTTEHKFFCHGKSQRSYDLLRTSPSQVRPTRTESMLSLNGIQPKIIQFLRFEVEDTGIGITPDKQFELFQPFKKVDQFSGGTGLGLYSLLKRCESLGGNCGVGNRRDQQRGSCFWFTFPYYPDYAPCVPRESLHTIHSLVIQDTESQPNLRSAPASPRNLNQMNILLVEDSILIQKTTSRALKTEGYQVDIARNGAECLEMVKKKEYDFILMDINMPVMDGIEATKHLREQELQSPHTTSNKKLRIIGVSANGDTETIQEALDIGMDDFLLKPLSLEELQECFDRLRCS